MSHAAEETLHAYLDVLERPESGALDPAGQAELERHLAQCEVCTAALAEARTLRACAGAVLASAAPVFDVPPFETMSARRAPARPVRRWVPLAWAASLMMAVGAGWIASGLWREGSIEAPFGRVQQAESAAEAPAAAAQAPAAQDAAAGDVATDAAGAPAASLQADASDARQAAEPPPTVSVEDLSARVEQVAIPERRLEAEQLRVPAASGERSLGAKARAAESAAGAAAPAAPPPPAAAPGAQENAANRIDGDAAFPGDADVAWEPVSMTTAAALLGGPLDLVAGARVLSIEAADSARVRVVQRLAGGAEVELVQRPAGGGALAQAERADVLRVVREGRSADGRAWVVVSRDGRELALRAPAGMVPLALVAQLERR